MTIVVEFEVTPVQANPGDTLTATYTITGNDANAGDPQTVVIQGSVQVGDTAYPVSTEITIPGPVSNPLPVTYSVPTCPVLTFVPTGDPAVFTAVVPGETPPTPEPPSGDYQAVTAKSGGPSFNVPDIIDNSNGYNTYVLNNMWASNPGTVQTTYVKSPADWYVESNAVPVSYTGVQTYPCVQQLFSNYDGAGGWSGVQPVPINALASLISTYAEDMGDTTGIGAQAAWDIWVNNYGIEIMVWVDTTPLRGNGGATKLDEGVLASGQAFDYYEWQPPNGIPIFIFRENQKQGTVDLLSVLNYLVARGRLAATDVVNDIDFGFEICTTGGAMHTFRVTDYSLHISF